MDHELILVVDDDPSQRELVRRILERRWRVIEAESQAEALALLEREPVDLVVCDLVLPEASGLDVCRRIKEAQGAPFVPVVLITARRVVEDRYAGLAAGADAFLLKPIDRRELELRVAALLRIRAQDRALRRQLDELREVAALKDDLVDVLVHDLRNPLAGMVSLLGVIAREVHDPELREDVAMTQRAAARLEQTVDDLLEVRWLEERVLPEQQEPPGSAAARLIERRRVLLAELVAEGVAAAREAMADRALEVTCRIETDVTVEVDPRLVRRAISNLVAQALRYSRTGGTVEVSVALSGDAVEVLVADRGQTIPDELKEALFEKFGSVTARARDARRSYGLGLYLVKLVAAAHGGSVGVADRDGGGVVSRLRLPWGGG